MDQIEVRNYLPHRYPFLLIDRVLSVEVGKSVVAIKNVSNNEPFFNGHFPNQPIMPGVLIIEALAQAAGVLGFVSQGKRPSDNSMYVLCGVDKARFKRRVVPGDQLELTATLVAVKRNILKFSGEARVNGELAASAELIVAEQPREE
ncbi:MAG: 3-hydroxyacyl-ACP dehydratase FabZ [Gammaproteobacteria bacterium]|jgi:3-hydroxyacyl-[acyl-carrier-protein] dehydratase|nr:3-hydroxyacyl-ACP dehydratase FabZ [Gammaproteobacteria bacterium]MBQ0775475.1 3-hydroxyacyl-ACP dehydratase FabZ [Gammaproteobacteria bacterium]|tara:strand:- start:29963 stop:30403 length:441 start_codon:yes stop_codon:yes gene_type:complete